MTLEQMERESLQARGATHPEAIPEEPDTFPARPVASGELDSLLKALADELPSAPKFMPATSRASNDDPNPKPDLKSTPPKAEKLPFARVLLTGIITTAAITALFFGLKTRVPGSAAAPPASPKPPAPPASNMGDIDALINSGEYLV